jgi:hypothetical protein
MAPVANRAGEAAFHIEAPTPYGRGKGSVDALEERSVMRYVVRRDLLFL